MTLTDLDKSNYLRGLIILVGIDKQNNENKRKIIKEVAKILGFNQAFVEDSLNEIYENKYINRDPPKFSNQVITEIFIRDGIGLASVNMVLHLHDIKWLLNTAVKNNLSEQFFFIELEYFLEKYDYENPFVIKSNLKSFIN
ncbi:MAG: hypothetical protein ACYC6P_14330 [Ignavibacteriaceae bacterium]